MVKPRHVLGVVLLLASWALPTPAYADHTELDRQTEVSAFTLQQEQLRLGLFKLEYGIFDAWSVGTYTAPWLLIPVTQSMAGDVYTKVKLLDVGRTAVSARAGVFYFDVNDFSRGDIEDGDFNATIFPLTAAVSYRADRAWTISSEVTWVQSLLSGDVSSTGDATALGAGAQNNLQFSLSAEWRVSRHVAINLLGRVAAYVAPAVLHTNATVDDSTTAELEAEITAEDAIGAWMLQPGVTYSKGTFNLRVGLGGGYLFVPGILLVSAQPFPGPLPDFDIYWRF